MKKVAILMGSASDSPVADKAVQVLEQYQVPYTVTVCSAHRTPGKAAEFAKTAREKGYGALICLAGLAAHLAGAIAANTTLPVVGVPVASGGLGGLDALLSTVQMPSGIPVATVAVGGAANAALLCVQMLAITDEDLAKRLKQGRNEMELAAFKADEALQNSYPNQSK